METKDKTSLLLLIVATVAMCFVGVHLDKPKDMIKIEFNNELNEPITVYADKEGVIRVTEHKEWQDCVIIGVKELRKGQDMQVYNLYTDVVEPKIFKVDKITH